MRRFREQHLVGLEALGAATELLQRGRSSHPTGGLFEAADLQWWWRTPRSTDQLPQLFWFDGADSPVAAVVMTDWGDRVALDPITMPGAEPAWIAHVVGRGLAHAAASGFGSVVLEVDRDDRVVGEVLIDRGFAVTENGLVEAWLAADACPPVGSLPAGFRLVRRSAAAARPHHLIARSGPHVEERLRQTSLYRPDLDLVVIAPDDAVAAYGLFWFDPVTRTGLVEPMRTESGYQRLGIARHVLTAGLDRLAAVGAERIKICYEADNGAARDLYLGVGFEPVRRTDVLAGPTGGPAP